ncbi:hypothetical protein tb265_30270 [Gemmatimonadetes bacterium T265]|nr:hypothetical protein tb265_30270 [Gemmatimonadetes bacterium T265]
MLLQYHPPNVFGQSGPYVRVRRADGATLDLGLMAYTYSTSDGGTVSVPSCCGIGADLSDTRLAVARSYSYDAYGYKSLTFDVTRGVRVDSTAGQLVALNNAGQSVEAVTDASGLYWSTYLVPHGFTPADLPNTLAASDCDRGIGRYSTFVPVDLDESANLIASYCGNLVWVPPSGGTSRWLDRLVGASRAVHLSRTGQIVASLDPTGAIYLWRPATGRTTRVQTAGTSWTIDSLAAVNGSGQIAAHGVDRSTGRTAALLLTPAASASTVARR